jgi:hypothetical protein
MVMMNVTYCFYYYFFMALRAAGGVAGMTAIAIALLLAGCESTPREAPAGVASGTVKPRPALSLTPWLSLTGARLSLAPDRTGTPSPRAGALSVTRFMRPLALAARGGDLVILDSGTGAAYRYDAALNIMSALGGVPAQAGTQLAMGADFSLYAVDQQGRRVLRIARNGQVLASYRDAINLPRPVDVAVDDARGLVIVADGTFNHLVAFHALGGASYVIPLRGAGGRPHAVSAIALGADAIYFADPLCRCVARVAYNGGVLATFGQDALAQPGALAVDRYQRVFVIDQFERALKVFERGILIATLPASRFGMQQIDDVWIDDSVLYLADGLGARVEAQRLSAPVRTQGP